MKPEEAEKKWGPMNINGTLEWKDLNNLPAFGEEVLISSRLETVSGIVFKTDIGRLEYINKSGPMFVQEYTDGIEYTARKRENVVAWAELPKYVC